MLCQKSSQDPFIGGKSKGERKLSHEKARSYKNKKVIQKKKRIFPSHSRENFFFSTVKNNSGIFLIHENNKSVEGCLRKN